MRALTDNTTPRCCDAFSQFSWLDTLRMMFFVGILLKCGVTTNSLGSSPQKFTPPLHPSGLYVRVGYKYGLVVPLFTHSYSLIGPTLRFHGYNLTRCRHSSGLDLETTRRAVRLATCSLRFPHEARSMSDPASASAH